MQTRRSSIFLHRHKKKKRKVIRKSGLDMLKKIIREAILGFCNADPMFSVSEVNFILDDTEQSLEEFCLEKEHDSSPHTAQEGKHPPVIGIALVYPFYCKRLGILRCQLLSEAGWPKEIRRREKALIKGGRLYAWKIPRDIPHGPSQVTLYRLQK